MGYVFRPNLYACDIGGSLVFLDLISDRYFALTEPAAGACLRLAKGQPIAPGDAEIAADLVVRGILISDASARPTLCRLAPPTVGSIFEVGTRPSIFSVMSACTRHALAIAEFKLRPLSAIMAGVAKSKRCLAVRTSNKGNPGEVVAAFAAADRVITAYGRCLPRSVAMARAMIANNIEPTVVVGVKLRPFEAHCWIQHGKRLVGDDLGTVAPFTPIFTI